MSRGRRRGAARRSANKAVEEARGRCRDAEVLLGRRKLAGEVGNDDTDGATPAAMETGDVGLDVCTMQASCRETQGRLGLSGFRRRKTR
jgi:hypothetical protein